MIAGNAIYRQPERAEKVQEPLVCGFRVVLDYIACHRDQVGAPRGGLIVFEHRGKCRMSDRAAQTGIRIGKEMRVCYV